MYKWPILAYQRILNKEFMNALEFSERLLSFKPDEILLRSTCSNEYIEYLLSSYNLKKVTNFPENDPVIDIVKNYDVSTFSVFTLYFLKEIVQCEEYIFFGEDEADYLAINQNSENIELINHDIFDLYGSKMFEGEKKDASMLKCAKNSDHFLDALMLAVKFSKEVNENTGGFRGVSDNVRKELCESAIIAAGGDSYRVFWEVVFGID